MPFENCPGVLPHIKNANDPHVCRQNLVADERFLDDDHRQIGKNSRFDVVTSARVFTDCDARPHDFIGNRHFDLSAKLPA